MRAAHEQHARVEEDHLADMQRLEAEAATKILKDYGALKSEKYDNPTSTGGQPQEV